MKNIINKYKSKKLEKIEYKDLHKLPNNMDDLNEGVKVLFIKSDDNALCSMLSRFSIPVPLESDS